MTKNPLSSNCRDYRPCACLCECICVCCVCVCVSVCEIACVWHVCALCMRLMCVSDFLISVIVLPTKCEKGFYYQTVTDTIMIYTIIKVLAYITCIHWHGGGYGLKRSGNNIAVYYSLPFSTHILRVKVKAIHIYVRQ